MSCVFVSQWSWWHCWERWPSPQGPAGHWPAGRTSSSRHWWLIDHKKNSSGNKGKSESIFRLLQSQSDYIITLHHLIHSLFSVNPMHTSNTKYKDVLWSGCDCDFWPFLYRKWKSGEQIQCHRLLWKWKTTEPRDSPTHYQQHSLSMWMMTQLDSAASVCHHLPTSNHDGEKKSPRLPTTKYSHTFSHPCEHEQTPFSITKNFLGQMLISYGSGFKSSSLSFSLFLNHKSFNSAAQTVLVSPLFPLDTMRINYIKAGLVNLAGESCKRHWELKLCGTMRIILPLSVCLVQLLDTCKTSFSTSL